ncbi:MAG: UDP-N-acetylglucosamine--N-acetylmuramyl-(pentapeptide) pyrophosphoryl-undecaprenol N-acetylglucosamine transferase [Clostridia bacterium]|nr:UDP-N-acetylglucosamine--N-acetylmuramyl-(pentapeptide) pyrophosphoryl-undecaprenol N-acetylglucosamine transferase [Clostridia bacterium]
MQKRTAIFTGGGTGGHIYPNLALIPDFEKRGFLPLYVGGTGDVMERRLAKLHSIPYRAVPAIKFARGLTFDSVKNNLKIPITLKRGIDEAKKIIKDSSPAFVFSKGGFVSLPIVIAAAKLGVPVFAHESDRTLGLANKIARFYGATILKGNPTATFEGENVGIPLRKELFANDRQSARQKLGIENVQKKVLLVLGGSSGATALNGFVKANLKTLTDKFFVLHVTGRGKTDKLQSKNYLSFEYAEEIGDFYFASDVVLSRAGATAVAEISALRKRAVFVPLPKGASRGDQIFNAQLAQEFGAQAVEQSADQKTFFDNLITAIDSATKNPPMKAISADTNGKIVNLVCDSISKKVDYAKTKNNGKMAGGGAAAYGGGGMLRCAQHYPQKERNGGTIDGSDKH